MHRPFKPFQSVSGCGVGGLEFKHLFVEITRFVAVEQALLSEGKVVEGDRIISLRLEC